MKFLFGIMIAFCAAATAKRQPTESWSNPGVTFDRYRADAIECGKLGFFRDVSNDEPAKRFIRGFQSGDDALNRAGGPDDGEWQRAILRTQPDRRRRELHAIQVDDVERCLIAKGYRKFRLDRTEKRQLARYRVGSEGRHRYLHTLAAGARPASSYLPLPTDVSSLAAVAVKPDPAPSP